MTLTRRLVFGRNPRRTTIRILVLAAISFVIFTWVLLPVRTEGISMQPTYESGRLVLVNRLSYWNARPQRGDVVAIRLAGEHVLYVKRIVGLPGERIAISGGLVEINGIPIIEPYVHNRSPIDVPEVVLGPDEYFVIGDNRARNATDFGRTHVSRIAGKLVF